MRNSQEAIQAIESAEKDEAATAEAIEIQTGQVEDALHALGLAAYTEQTGGGTATIFVGNCDIRSRYPETDDLYFPVAIGPGVYDWIDSRSSTFSAAECCVGPDEEGPTDEYEYIAADDVETFVAKIVEAAARIFARETTRAYDRNVPRDIAGDGYDALAAVAADQDGEALDEVRDLAETLRWESDKDERGVIDGLLRSEFHLLQGRLTAEIAAR